MAIFYLLYFFQPSFMSLNCKRMLLFKFILFVIYIFQKTLSIEEYRKKLLSYSILHTYTIVRIRISSLCLLNTLRNPNLYDGLAGHV